MITSILFLLAGASVWLLARPPYTAAHIKNGVLVGVLIVLLEHMPAAYRTPPMVSELRRIQRELAFGRMSPELALRTADLAIDGLDFTALVDAEVRRVMGLMELEGHVYAKIEQSARALREAINADGGPTEHSEAQLEHATSIATAIAALNDVNASIIAANKALRTRVDRIMRVAPEVTDAVNRLFESLASIEAARHAASQRIMAETQAIIDEPKAP